MHASYLHCATCRTERRFEVPPCADGHGADCAELICTSCGAAILSGARFAPVGDIRRLVTGPGRQVAA